MQPNLRPYRRNDDASSKLGDATGFNVTTAPTIARVAVVLEIFLGLGALFGGGQFIAAPNGHVLGMTTEMLAGTPFPSYLVPGIIHLRLPESSVSRSRKRL